MQITMLAIVAAAMLTAQIAIIVLSLVAVATRVPIRMDVGIAKVEVLVVMVSWQEHR